MKIFLKVFIPLLIGFILSNLGPCNEKSSVSENINSKKPIPEEKIPNLPPSKEGIPALIFPEKPRDFKTIKKNQKIQQILQKYLFDHFDEISDIIKSSKPNLEACITDFNNSGIAEDHKNFKLVERIQSMQKQIAEKIPEIKTALTNGSISEELIKALFFFLKKHPSFNSYQKEETPNAKFDYDSKALNENKNFLTSAPFYAGFNLTHVINHNILVSLNCLLNLINDLKKGKTIENIYHFSKDQLNELEDFKRSL